MATYSSRTASALARSLLGFCLRGEADGLQAAALEPHLRPGPAPQHAVAGAQPDTETGDDGDRELQPLRAVNRQDAHRVVVGFGHDSLEHVGLGLDLVDRPGHEVGEPRAARVAEGPRLVDQEPQSSPVVAGPA